MYLPIHHTNKFALDHCDILEWPMSAGQSSDTYLFKILWDDAKNVRNFCSQKNDYILRILRLLGILSYAWNIVRENKKWL